MSDEHVDVKLQAKSSWTEPEAREVIRSFKQELLDQELREHIADETAPVRTLILAQAFSKTGLIREE